MLDIVLSIVVLAAVVLFGGAIFLFRQGETKRATLMAVLAFIMLANVAIWVMPVGDGDSLAASGTIAE